MDQSGKQSQRRRRKPFLTGGNQAENHERETRPATEPGAGAERTEQQQLNPNPNKNLEQEMVNHLGAHDERTRAEIFERRNEMKTHSRAKVAVRIPAPEENQTIENERGPGGDSS
jgi:hypothetical protein